MKSLRVSFNSFKLLKLSASVIEAARRLEASSIKAEIKISICFAVQDAEELEQHKLKDKERRRRRRHFHY